MSNEVLPWLALGWLDGLMRGTGQLSALGRWMACTPVLHADVLSSEHAWHGDA